MRRKLLLRCPTRFEALAALLILTVCITIRSWVAVVGKSSEDFDGGRTNAERGRASSSCEWNKKTGGVLFRLTHKYWDLSTMAEHWFHIAEFFMAFRADLEASHSLLGGTRTVYLQALDAKWMARLTPMTRLLLSAGLASAGVDAVHFVDLDRASFCFIESGDPDQPNQSLRGGAPEDVDSVRVSVDHCPPDSRDRWAPDGQVGWLRYAYPAKGVEFVVSTDQPVSERFSRSAVETPSETRGKISDEPKALAGSRGSGGGERSNGPASAAEAGGVCVKTVATLGFDKKQRVDWFSSPGSAMSLRKAIDTFCPISWLQDGRGKEEAKGDRVGRRDAGRTADGCVPWTMNRRLLIYQRDRNRKITGVSELVENLQERLGPHGWTIETMMHTEGGHPCDIVSTISAVDILVTAHGFQSMLAIFMRPGSLLFEIYPHKYYKPGYGPMVDGLSIRHGFVRSRAHMPLSGFKWPSEDACMNNLICRWYVRLSNVDLSEEDLTYLVQLAHETQACGRS